MKKKTPSTKTKLGHGLLKGIKEATAFEKKKMNLRNMTLEIPHTPTEFNKIQTKEKTYTKFDSDLMKKLRDLHFASNYIMAAIIDNDMDFLPIALGDVAKAHGISKLSEETGINRRVLYNVFNEKGRPSFTLVTQIIESLGMEIQVRPKKSKKSKAS